MEYDSYVLVSTDGIAPDAPRDSAMAHVLISDNDTGRQVKLMLTTAAARNLREAITAELDRMSDDKSSALLASA